jgi:hypothetical protein
LFFVYKTPRTCPPGGFFYPAPLYIQCRTPEKIMWLWGVGIILYKQRCPTGEIDGFAYPRTLAKNISIVQELFANFLSIAKRDPAPWIGLAGMLVT